MTPKSQEAETVIKETILNTLKKLWLFEYDGIDEDLRGVCLRISLLGFLLVLLYFT
jgi:hypothetical protein